MLPQMLPHEYVDPLRQTGEATGHAKSSRWQWPVEGLWGDGKRRCRHGRASERINGLPDGTQQTATGIAQVVGTGIVSPRHAGTQVQPAAKPGAILVAPGRIRS